LRQGVEVVAYGCVDDEEVDLGGPVAARGFEAIGDGASGIDNAGGSGVEGEHMGEIT
jgi:hypothetical protein